MASARVFTFATGLSERESDAAQASMPKDDYNAPYKRKRAILQGLGFIDDDQRVEGVAAAVEPAAPAGDLTLVYEPSPNLDLALAAHDRGLLDYLSTAWERWAAMPEDQRCQFFQRSLPSSGLSEAEGRDDDKVPALVPSNGCARQDPITRPGNSLHSQTCYYHTDMDTPIFRELLPALKADIAVLQAVVNAVSLDNNVDYRSKNKDERMEEKKNNLVTQPAPAATSEEEEGRRKTVIITTRSYPIPDITPVLRASVDTATSTTPPSSRKDSSDETVILRRGTTATTTRAAAAAAAAAAAMGTTKVSSFAASL